VKIALAQVNPTVGDLGGNRRLVEEAAERAAQHGAELELEALAPASRRIAIALGAVLPGSHRGGKHLTNAAVLLQGGERSISQAKTLLPTYDV
jgi:NAD+ synthase (glutamine-hydrolysing)